MRLLQVLLLLSAVGTASAYQPDYFPLQVGNQWIYRQLGVAAGPAVVVEVTEVAIFEQKPYARVTGFPSGDAWLRLEDDGRLVAWDEQTGSPRPWLAFGADVGSPFPTEVNPCNNTGTIVNRAAEIRGPIGEFNYALEVSFTPSCADAGIVRDYYLPSIGLIQREETTIAGPRLWELVYARLGGVTYVTEPSVSFGLALSHQLSPGGPPILRARMTLRNNRLAPIKLDFSTAQRFNLVIRDADGNTVYDWALGKLFAQNTGSEEVAYEKNYVVEVPLDLAPGSYSVEAWLTTTGPRRFAATAGFEALAPNVVFNP